MGFSEEIKMIFGGDTGPVQEALRGLPGIAENAAGKMSETFTGLGKHIGEIFSAAGVIAITEKLFTLTQSIERTSEASGLSAEEVQRFSFATRRAGVDAEQTEKSLEHLAQKIGEARNGAKEAVAVFAKWHISLSDASGEGLNTQAIITQISDAMAALEDPTQRAALAVDILGKSGAKMVAALGQGSKALGDVEAKAKILSNESIANIKEFHEQVETGEDSLMSWAGNVLTFFHHIATGIAAITITVGRFGMRSGAEEGEIQGVENDMVEKLQAHAEYLKHRKDAEAAMKRATKERMDEEATLKKNAAHEDQVRQESADMQEADSARRLRSEIGKLAEKDKSDQQQYNDALKERNKLQDAYIIASDEFGLDSVKTLQIQLDLQRQLNALKTLGSKPDVTPEPAPPKPPVAKPPPAPVGGAPYKPWKTVPAKPWRAAPAHAPWKIPGMAGNDDPSTTDYDYHAPFKNYSNTVTEVQAGFANLQKIPSSDDITAELQKQTAALTVLKSQLEGNGVRIDDRNTE